MTATRDSRPRFRLGTRLFLGTSLLLIFAVGASVVGTSVLARRIARQAVEEALATGSSVEEGFRARRYEQLQLLSLLFVSDPYLTAYVAEGAQTLDRRSMADLLLERQADLGFDFAILLDPDGRVLARTDRPSDAGEDLSNRPLVATALSEYEAAGMWREGDQLFHAVAVPLIQRLDLLGFLVAGFEIRDDTAREVRQVSRTEVVYLVGGEGDPRVVASTFGPQDTERLLELLASRSGSGTPREGVDAVRLVLDGEPWIARMTPLTDAAGGRVGASVALASLDRAMAPYRRIGTVLLAAGGVALLFAFALSYALGRRTVRPVERLVAAVEAARRGDYDQPIPRERRDEVGQLATAFEDLLRELKERREMERYMAELSRNLPEPATAPALTTRTERPDRDELTLLAIEVPGWAVLAGQGEAGTVVESWAAELRSFADRITTAGGGVLEVAGHRLWAGFTGEYGPWAAVATAVQIWDQRVARGEGEGPAFAVTSGPAVTGAAALQGRDHRLLLGRPVQQIESLLREATVGEILLSREVHRRLVPVLQSVGLELAPRRGVASGIELFALTPRLASRLPRPAAVATGAAPAGTSRAPTRTASGTATDGSLAGALRTLGPGTVLGNRFEILDLLGSGGMGVVYKARDRELDDVVALKVLRPDKAGDPELLERLKEELKLARRITHPNVLRTHDLGTLDGVPFLSMEYVRGLTLRQLLDRLEGEERLPDAAALRLMRQIAHGLGAVHECGVIHRDLKPGNVILEPTGNAKLMDFGIARATRPRPKHLTTDSAIVGTPGYLAPEQLEGGQVTRRTDLFAWGAVGYELLTGQLPFVGSTPMEQLMRTLDTEPVPPRKHRPDLDPRLDELLLRCLQKNPEQRPGSTDEVLAALAGVDRGA